MSTTLGERLRLAITDEWRPQNGQNSIRNFQEQFSAWTSENRPPDFEGRTYPAINSYLLDRVKPSLDWLEAAAEFIGEGVRVEWLAFDSGEMTEEAEKGAQLSRARVDERLKRMMAEWRSEKGQRKMALWDGEEGLSEWRMEAVLRLDDLLEASGPQGALAQLHGVHDRLVLLQAARDYLRAAESALQPREPRDPKPQDVDEYHERLALQLLVSDPTTKREDYALWADQVLRTFASQVKGLGMPLSPENRAMFKVRMEERTAR